MQLEALTWWFNLLNKSNVTFPSPEKGQQLQNEYISCVCARSFCFVQLILRLQNIIIKLFLLLLKIDQG